MAARTVTIDPGWEGLSCDHMKVERPTNLGDSDALVPLCLPALQRIRRQAPAEPRNFLAAKRLGTYPDPALYYAAGVNDQTRHEANLQAAASACPGR